MHTISFKLRQHTPLIHFHDQPGATLRATELKPKLDKHLQDIVFNFDFESCKTMLTGFTPNDEKLRKLKDNYDKGYNALDYKLRVQIVPGSILPDKEIPEKYPCFFANMGEENMETPKTFSFITAPVILQFQSNHNALLNIISEEIPNFLARNNFGTRQSKGFGSFYLDETDPKFIDPPLYSYFVCTQPDEDYRNIFAEIEMVHKVYRSGINDIGRDDICYFYMKPLIWQYFRNKGINWDKKKVKIEFYDRETGLQKTKPRNQEAMEDEPEDQWPLYYENEIYKMVKDLLGLSSLEKWRVPYGDSISKDSEDIARMKSPLFYKPLKVGNEWRIYFDFNPIPEGFFNAPFTISSKRKRLDFRLSTPNANDFDLEDFISWSLTKANIRKLIAPPYTDSKKAKLIINIFNQLRENIIKD